MAEGLTATFGVKVQFDLAKSTPMIRSDPRVSEMIFKAAQGVLGNGGVAYIPPHMGSDDFAYFAAKRPASIIRLGCANPDKGIVHPLHSPYFGIDEGVIGVGIEVFFKAVCDFLVKNNETH